MNKKIIFYILFFSSILAISGQSERKVLKLTFESQGFLIEIFQKDATLSYSMIDLKNKKNSIKKMNLGSFNGIKKISFDDTKFIKYLIIETDRFSYFYLVYYEGYLSLYKKI